MPVCTAKCTLEVTGQGLMSQEIALMFYTGMRDSPDGCTYPAAKSKFWKLFETDMEVYKTLKEPAVLQECIDALIVCYPGASKLEQNLSCFRGHYQYCEAIREKKKACLQKKCPDNYYCWSGESLPYKFWMDGITQVQ